MQSLSNLTGSTDRKCNFLRNSSDFEIETSLRLHFYNSPRDGVSGVQALFFVEGFEDGVVCADKLAEIGDGDFGLGVVGEFGHEVVFADCEGVDGALASACCEGVEADVEEVGI